MIQILEVVMMNPCSVLARRLPLSIMEAREGGDVICVMLLLLLPAPSAAAEVCLTVMYPGVPSERQLCARSATITGTEAVVLRWLQVLTWSSTLPAPAHGGTVKAMTLKAGQLLPIGGARVEAKPATPCCRSSMQACPQGTCTDCGLCGRCPRPGSRSLVAGTPR